MKISTSQITSKIINSALQELSVNATAEQQAIPVETCKEMYKADEKECDKPWEKWQMFFHGTWVRLNKKPVFHDDELYRRVKFK